MKKEIVIIGAGPAGLAVAGCLSKHNIEFTLLEKSEHIAHSWREHYDRLHLHTVKQLSHLPYLPFPDHYPTYVSKQQLIDYFEEYCRQFKIDATTSADVKSITGSAETGWVIQYNDKTIFANHVVVCTGVNNAIHQPSWPGMASYQGQIIHSRAYKNPKAFNDQRVLVIGMGNSGAEIALDLAEHKVEVDISVRGEINVVPRDLNGQPVQLTSRKLARLPFGLGDWLGSQIRKIYFGDLSKYGLKTSTLPPAKQLLTTGKTPTIDIGTIAAIKKRLIQVREDIKQFTPEGIEFVDGSTAYYDTVICATGYRANLPTMIPGISAELDKNGLPKNPIAAGTWKGLYFVGYDNYKLGGILGTIYIDADLVANTIAERIGSG